MTEIKNLVINLLSKLVPCESLDFRVGSADFYLTYDQSLPATNPLRIKLFSDPDGKSNPSVINYSLSNSENSIIHIKRIRQTPFYFSQFDDGDTGLQIIDFYQWFPATTIFRVFYYQSCIKNPRLKISIPPVIKTINDHVLQLNDAFFGYYSLVEGKLEKDNLTFFLNENNLHPELVVTAFSQNFKELEDLTPQKIVAKMNRLTEISKTNHIQNSIKVQDKKIEKEIDEIWSREKSLTPDLKPDISLKKNLGGNRNHTFWTRELCRLMEWKSPLDVINNFSSSEIRPETSQSEMDETENQLIALYKADQYLSKDVQVLLQRWWNQYSLPLYRIKVEKKLKAFPENLFIIYFIALCHRVCWHEQLYSICDQFTNWPILALLAKIYQLFVVTGRQETCVTFLPGCQWTGNSKGLSRERIGYRLTRFGQKIYTSLAVDKKEIVKIDKEAVLKFDQSENVISVLSAINDDELRCNTVTLIVDKFTLKFPLIWRKTEISFQGLRLRYLFKKDRFQLTFQKKKNIEYAEMNGEKLTFDRSLKLTRYLAIKAEKIHHGLGVYDNYGRTYHLNKNHSIQSCIVHGWLQDKFGILVEKINLIMHSQQKLFSSSQAGLINYEIDIPAEIDQVKIVAKKLNTIITKGKTINSFVTKLLSYSVKESDGCLVVVVDDNLSSKIKSIKRIILQILEFHPYYILKSEIKFKLSYLPLIFITSADDKIGIEDKSVFSNLPFLRVGISEDLNNIASAFLPD